jgi:hypothetical protein
MNIWTIIWNFIKKVFANERTIWIVIVALLIGAIWFGIGKYKKLYNNYDNSVQNSKAYAAQLDNEKAKSNVFKVTIEQLEYYNDSIAHKLVETKNKLGVKDKEVKQLQYLATTFKKTDTIYLSDTVFKEPDFRLDTVVGDEWASTRVMLEYPNLIGVEPEVKSEKVVAISTTRETVDPPKKFFLCRWFQKKHTVIKVVVDEKNQHIKTQENVFFEIVE